MTNHPRSEKDGEDKMVELEEQPPGEGTSAGDQEERGVARLLNPIPGEEDDEQVPDLIVEGLL